MPDLRSKFEGCIAATWIGSAMGAVVEGWDPEEIDEEYGRLDELHSYEHYGNGWERPPGTTEDGIERQKLYSTAIIENDGRIDAHDLVAVWLRDLDPDRMVYKQEGFDVALRRLAEADVPPPELGRQWPYPNVVSVARSSHPIGLINAGNPEQAAEDTIQTGQAYASETDLSLRWAALYNAAIAEACRPDATVESVLATAREFAEFRHEPLYDRYDTVAEEIDRAIEFADEHDTFDGLRDAFYEHYHGAPHVTYGMSLANEVVAKGLAVFAFTEGDPERAITHAVSFGRDTDCLAATASGLAGTLSGSEPIPDPWIQQVDEATEEDPYTNADRSIEETAAGLYRAYRSHHRRERERLRMMAEDDYLPPTERGE